MSLDPRTVLAGIDGTPLIRYNPAISLDTLSLDSRLNLARGVLNEAGIQTMALELSGEVVKVELAGDASLKPSPYLSWQLEKATGLRFECKILAPLKVEKPVEQPVSAEPAASKVKALKQLKPLSEKTGKTEPKVETKREEVPPPPRSAKPLDLLSRFKALKNDMDKRV